MHPCGFKAYCERAERRNAGGLLRGVCVPTVSGKKEGLIKKGAGKVLQLCATHCYNSEKRSGLGGETECDGLIDLFAICTRGLKTETPILGHQSRSQNQSVASLEVDLGWGPSVT